LVAAARDGMSGALVVRGEAGIGKSSVLDYAASIADGFATLRADGVEPERDIGFAALHRLLLPVLDDADALPAPQRVALDATFGRVAGAPPDRFLVGLAVLTLAARVAERRPLLCVVDDAQWVDGESADLLAFVARRLYAEGVVMVFGVREPVDGRDRFAGLPELSLTGLPPADARRLLNAAAAGPLDPATTARLLLEAEGNPLALVELGRDHSLGGRTSTLLPVEPVPLQGRLEQHFRRQVEALPAPTQLFLLIAAAEPNDAALIWKAADRLGVPYDAAEPAAAARLIDPRGMPMFRHPLVRSAVYGAATPAARRLVHTTLAELDDPPKADSRAWHLAAAAEGPDETVAAELERAAARAHARGGWAERAAFLERAAEITPEGPHLTERLLCAAEAALIAGTPVHAHALVQRARPALAGPRELARARRVEAALQSFTLPGRVPAVLLEAARALEPVDPAQARDTFTEALQACLVSCQLTAGTTPDAVGAAALAAPHATGEPQIGDLMLQGFATRFAVGQPEAAPTLQRAVAALCADDLPAAGLTRWSILGNNAANDLWDSGGYRTMVTRLEQAERQRGALESLRITLGGLGHCLMWAGDFAAAEAAHVEAAEISVALGEDATTFDALKVELFAWQGREADTQAAARFLTGKQIEVAGGGVGMNIARLALVMLALAQGRYEDALATGRMLMGDDPCPHGSHVLPEVVEAAARSGDETSARTALTRLRQRAEASGTAWALGLLARSEALAGPGGPDAHFRRAIDLLGATYVKTDLARAHLLYGEWLRRERHRVEAREQLRTAFELFDAMGATAFAERARIELAATGERARRRTVETALDLTPQERQIATLAASGATNQEIAAKLFLSASTVDYHLRKVFRKLAVTSRRHLGAALDGIT
jgi:DNA-binding CsgD family transcriptional regulator